jgi:hypothetical protein
MRSAPNPHDVGGTVFISYSHDSSDHVRSVLTLSNKLRSEGIDCVLDQYEACPPEGWPRWMDREINKAQFVLMICTQAYYRRVMGEEKPGVGLGIAWEGNLIYNHIYASGSLNTKFIPVIFDQEHAKYIPTPIQGATRYCVSADYGYGYEQLYSRLIGKPPIGKPPLGKRKALPEREVKTDFARLLATPFEPELWEKADWRAMVFELPVDRPPALGLGFVNEDAARKIFRQWLEWVGPRDEREELRVSIIEGDIPGQRLGYSVHVGLDAQALLERYKKMGVATDRDLFVTPSELIRSNDPNSPQLAAFREAYRSWKTYFLAPAIINKDGTKALKLLSDLKIYKGKIHFRHVSEIGEDDADWGALETPEYQSEVFTRICDILREGVRVPVACHVPGHADCGKGGGRTDCMNDKPPRRPEPDASDKEPPPRRSALVRPLTGTLNQPTDKPRQPRRPRRAANLGRYLWPSTAKKVREENRAALCTVLQEELLSCVTITIGTIMKLLDYIPNTSEAWQHLVIDTIVPYIDTQSIYDSNFQQLGLLSPYQISHVMAAYHTQKLVNGTIHFISSIKSEKILQTNVAAMHKAIPFILGAQERIMARARALGGSKLSLEHIAVVQDDLDKISAEYKRWCQKVDVQ